MLCAGRIAYRNFIDHDDEKTRRAHVTSSNQWLAQAILTVFHTTSIPLIITVQVPQRIIQLVFLENG